jgi:hypothetical protein
MTDHDHLSNTPDPGADDRIDALARAAGNELRRPAPADGIASVQRAKRRRQTAQLGGAGVAAVAILAVGAIAIGGRDAGPTVVPATVSTVDTPDRTTPDTTPDTTVLVDETVPETTGGPTPTSDPPPDTTVVAVPPNAAGAPSAVYTSATPVVMADGDQTLVDPVTGEVLGTEPMDADAARAAQDALLGRTSLPVTRTSGGSSGQNAFGQDDFGYFTNEYDIGGITYALDALPSEVSDIGAFSPETLGRFDRCGQSELRVTGAAADALPDRASTLTFSADGRWSTVLSATCSDPGTLADGRSPSIEWSVTLFDATRPDLPGRTIGDLIEPVIGTSSFSPDGQYVAVEANEGLRFFETDTGTEIDVVSEECFASGTKWSRFIGPWIGESSVALQVRCDDTWSLQVEDLATGESIDVAAPVDEIDFGLVVDVDFAHYDRPSNTWFTMCVTTFDAGTSTQSFDCWIGQGGGPLVELTDTAEASFLPLGFTYGG